MIKNYDKPSLKKADKEHHFHPFTHHQSLWGEGGARIITSAKGAYLKDIDGHDILDFMAGLWCVNVGYGREEIAEVAYQQIKELNYYNSFFKTTTPPTAELSKKIASLLKQDLNYIFYGSSGSESNDTVMRTVRQYWQAKNMPKKQAIISRENAYHGSTVAGASLGGMALMHQQAGRMDGVYHIMQPYSYKYAKMASKDEVEAFGIRAADELEKKILELGADTVAAFIGEPIQGAGGVIIPPDSYWPRINEICEKYDILLVADEVICGFGRTGEWFAHPQMGAHPHMVTMAKGISSGYVPLSAVAIRQDIADILADNGGEEYAHGYTYSGHPVSCAVALKNIEIIERENLIEKVRNHTAPYLNEALQEIATHPLVGEVRVRGLMGAIELSPDKGKQADFDTVGKVGTICRDHAVQNNLVIRACRDVMVLSPPLIIDKGDIDKFKEITLYCLDKTMQDIGL